MKNLILKWLGLDQLGFTKLNGNGGFFDLVEDELNRTYDLGGMSSKLDDMKYLLEDLESRADRWNDMADKLEDMDMEAIIEEVGNQVDFDKVQELDDRLTELLSGYKLEVKLTQENY
jgi:predicted nuclease with TOPRIM domain